MHIETLYYLLAIEKYGSTRKAAEVLNTSYQNVSRVLQQTEEEWQVQLFQRGSKGMQPTKEGRLAIASAKEMLRIYQHLLEQFHYRAEFLQPERNDRLSGKLAVGSSMVANNAFVNDLLVEFSAQYPRIQVILEEEDAYLPNAKREHRLFLVPRLPTELQEKDCEVIPLLQDKMVLLVRKDNVLLQQKSIALARLVKLPLVLIYKNRWEDSIFSRLFQANDVAPNKSIATNSVIGFQKYVATGQYVGLSTEIISHKLMSEKKQLFELIPIRDKAITFEYCLMIRDAKQLTRSEQCFVNFIKESFHLTS